VHFCTLSRLGEVGGIGARVVSLLGRRVIVPLLLRFCWLDFAAGGVDMAWHVYVAYFFGGMFLVNAVPHFVCGVMGRRFPSPFASPPGKGESSPMVNVFWGAFNLVVGYLLVFRVGEFFIRDSWSVAALGVGGLVMAVMLAATFGKVYGAK
jgi:hypothetical protein